MSANHDGVREANWVLATVAAFEGRLTRFAIRLVGDEHLARDVVQHTFLRLCDAEHAVIEDRVGPWLFRVCRNRALDVIRKDGRTASLTVHASDQVPAREADPAVVAEQEDLARCVYQLLDGLATSQREVLELWLNGFGYPEIARITGRSEGHVRVIAHRGLTRLREHPRVRRLLELQPSTTPASAVEPDEITARYSSP